MILVIGTVRLPPENIAKARPAMAAMVAASRAEDGCHDYAYAEDLLVPGLIRVSEAWRDREALAAHFKTPHMAAWRAVFPDLSITDRNLSPYEAGEPEPI
ncbi:MAG: putative quinol monooxygenase [Caulobacter sp.]|nr:putative quinol monooxygenase [Caulobacter sp.]